MIKPNMPFAEYAAAPGVRVSAFDRETPAQWKWDFEHAGKETAALKFGRQLHAYVFEGWRHFAVKPNGVDLRTKAGMALKEQIEADGLELITESEHDTLEGILHSIMTATDENGVEYLAKCINHGNNEVSCFHTDESTGLIMKARIDNLPPQSLYPEGRPILDLKSCADLTEFGRDIINLKYYRRGAWYVDVANALGLNCLEFWLIAAEKSPPYPIKVVKLANENGLALGRAEYRKCLKELKRCHETDSWPAYPTAPDYWTPEPWFLKRINAAPNIETRAPINNPTPNQPDEMESDCLV